VNSSITNINFAVFKAKCGSTACVYCVVTINGGTFENNGKANTYKFCVDAAGTGSIKVGENTLTAGQNSND
jgi:hypothetical protein